MAGPMSRLRKLFEYGQKEEALKLSAPVTMLAVAEKNVSSRFLGLGFALGDVASRYPDPKEAIEMITEVAEEYVAVLKENQNAKKV